MSETELLPIEIQKNKSIEELYVQYRYLVKPTVYKYYSRYLKSMWKDDVFSCAEIGLYKGLLKIDINRVNNDISIASALVWSIRANVKEFERKMFGSENSDKRKYIYSTLSYNNTVGDNSCKNRSYQEYIFEAAIGDVNKELLLIDKQIEYIDLYNAINNLNKDEKYLIKKLMENKTLEKIGSEMGISKDKTFRLKKQALKKLKKMINE